MSQTYLHCPNCKTISDIIANKKALLQTVLLECKKCNKTFQWAHQHGDIKIYELKPIYDYDGYLAYYDYKETK